MWIGIGLLVIIGGFLAGRFVVVPAMGTMPDNLGWRESEGRFKRCPDDPRMPNGKCVSSTDPAESRTYIEPIPFDGDVSSAKERLLAIINDLPRHTIHVNQDTYIHVETRSAAWGFPDDTEFYFDTTNNVIHIRAAARLGEEDLGMNRQRVETIKAQF